MPCTAATLTAARGGAGAGSTIRGLLSFRAASPGFSLTSGLCPAFSPASAAGLWLDAAADEAQPIVDISCMKEKKLKRYVGNNTPP